MGSPLGLSSGKDNFNRSKAKYRYNKVNKKWDDNTSNNYDQSLFNDGSSLSYFPKTNDESNGYNIEREINSNNTSPHGGEMTNKISGDSIYDVRTDAIIAWSQNQSESMKLYARDFAYLRFLGVYPNNRLIVCRKFGNPAPNDLSRIHIKPVSTILSWRVPGEDFFKISFGEEWTEAEASFTDILNNIGDEFKMGSGGSSFNVGEKIAGGLVAVPLPGFSEIFQRKVMFELGLIDETGRDIIPSGNANLIKEAKRRKTVDDGQAGSGLMCKIQIPVKVEYEQKFIGGLDPTKAFYDILANVAQFGTQDAVFYLNGAGPAAAKFKKFLTKLKNNPRQAITDLIKGVIQSLKKMVSQIIQALGLGGDKAGDDGSGLEDGGAGAEKESPDFTGAINKLLDEVLKLVTGLVKKYEIRILGVVNALTGEPSGPWHVTIGNPKRPIFTSGDMITRDVSITLGETLAFNDLPSRITVEFTLENARSIGLSEIMSRFMQGQGRTYISGPSSWIETEAGKDFNGKDWSSASTKSASDNESNLSNTGTASTTSPIGGNETAASGTDGSQNIGSTQSNESFSSGSGQESTNGKDPDPDDIKNTGTVTDTPTPATNDVKPDATTNTNPADPASKPDNSKKTVSDTSVGRTSNSDLVDRRKKIDEELANTPETVTDSKGVTTLNPDREKLEEEKRRINSELEDREEDGTYKK